MSAVSKLENAVASLSEREQKALLAFLSRQIRTVKHKTRRGLRAASRPVLEGLSPDLSTNTRERVRELMAKRDAADR